MIGAVRWILGVLALSACGRLAFDDGSSLDAAGGDTGSSDGNPPAVGCSIAGNTIVCDDFEDPALGGWLNDSMTHVATPARSGSGAVRASISGPTEFVSLMSTAAVLPTVSTLALRFWINIPASSSLVQANFVTFSDSQSTRELTVLGYTDEVRVWRETSAMVGYPSGAVIPRDRWVCIELDVTIDNVSGSFELRMDGVAKITEAAIDTDGNGYDNFIFGLPYSAFPGQGAATIYYDDVHLGTQRVGCQ